MVKYAMRAVIQAYTRLGIKSEDSSLRLQNYVVMRVLSSLVLQGLVSLGFMGKLA